MDLREKWNKSYEIAKDELSEEEYEWLENARDDSSPGSVTEKLRQKMEAREYAQDKDGRKILTRDRIHKILRSIDKYAVIVDVAVSHNPELRLVLVSQITYGRA